MWVDGVSVCVIVGKNRPGVEMKGSGLVSCVICVRVIV